MNGLKNRQKEKTTYNLRILASQISLILAGVISTLQTTRAKDLSTQVVFAIVAAVFFGASLIQQRK